jgi:AraC-like DNA-binding protein
MIVTLTRRHFCEKNLSPDTSRFTPSFILCDQANSYQWSGAGQLSLKTFRGGEVRYSLPAGGEFLLDYKSYLILNAAQPYSITIDAPQPVKSFCLFFEEGLAEEICRSLSTATATLMDTPDRIDLTRREAIMLEQPFFERTYPHDPLLLTRLSRLEFALNPANSFYPEQSWLHEQFHQIMLRLLWLHCNLYQEIENFKTKRFSTRQELYRRLHLAREYLMACYSEPLTLDDVARVAALSPNHLLRSFKQLFGQTPYQYLTGYRVKKACELLTRSELTVTAITHLVGFESTGSFSWWFKNQTGVSPLGYRTKNKKGDFEETPDAYLP